LNKKSLLSLEKKEFACEADAISAAEDFGKNLIYHSLTGEWEVLRQTF
jgi:hypothetical protein